MAPPFTPLDGRMTSFQTLPFPLTGGELMWVVSPGTAAQGNLYNVQTSTLATFFGGAVNPQNGDYTLLPADDFSTIVMGGNALNTLTVNAASTYGSPFRATIYNADGGRGKLISINGLSSFILWPLQTATIFNSSNAWKVTPNKQRWLNVAQVTFNVDNVNGSDSATNDGLGAQGTSGAFRTVGNALRIWQQFVDPAATTTLIQLPPNTGANPITEQLAASGAMPFGVAEVTIQGNAGSPTSCVWNCGANNTTYVSATDYLSLTFQGIGFSAGVFTGNTFVSGSQYAILDFFNCDFGPNTNGVYISVASQARCNILSGCSMSGTATAGQFLQATLGANGGIASLAINGTFNVGIFANTLFGGSVDLTNLAFTGAGAISGTRFLARWGGTIRGDSGVAWPGGLSAGSAILGGLSDAAITTFGGALVTSPTSGIGYGAGAGGIVVQSTNKATGVTLNTASGAITMNNATLNAGAIVSFVLTDSTIGATDVLILNHISGGTPGSYGLNAQCAAGSATINVRNNSAGNLSEAIVLQFVVFKAATS